MVHENIDIKVPGYEGTARLSTYFLDNFPEMGMNKTRPCVLICPGGGYGFVSDREAEPIAMKMLSFGYHAAVLRYNVAPHRYPEALLQAAGAVLYLRKNAEKYHIDANKIVLQGFSAGGHLAASFGVFWKQSFIAKAWGANTEDLRPFGLILCYPVITSGKYAHHGTIQNLLGDAYEEKKDSMSLELQVNEDTPATFIWSTTTDALVPVQNSLLFYQALLEKGIPAELHIYRKGAHGLALADEETKTPEGLGMERSCQSWILLARDWLKGICGE